MTIEFEHAYPDPEPEIWRPSDAEGHLLVIEPRHFEYELTEEGEGAGLRANVYDVTAQTTRRDVHIPGLSALRMVTTTPLYDVVRNMKPGRFLIGQLEQDDGWLLRSQAGVSPDLLLAVEYPDWLKQD